MPKQKDANGFFGDGCFKDCEKFTVTLITGSNPARNMWYGNRYQLDVGAATALYSWLVKMRSSIVTYNVVFMDAQGSEVYTHEWRVDRLRLLNVDVDDHCTRNDDKSLNFYISPFVGCAARSYIEWEDMLIDTSLLNSFNDVKIEYSQIGAGL